MADRGKTSADKAADSYLMSFVNNDITSPDFHSGMESGDKYYEDDILQVHSIDQAHVNSRRGTVSRHPPSPHMLTVDEELFLVILLPRLAPLLKAI